MRHPDLPTGYELKIVCPFHPECECESGCTAGGDRRRAQIAFLALVALTAAIGAGVVLWSFLP